MSQILSAVSSNDSQVSSPREKVVVVNRSYWPDLEATGQLLTDLCEHLAERFEVHVVCGQPNSVADGVEYVQRGQQTLNGVTIHRLTHSTFRKSSFGGRILNLISFSNAARRYLAKSSLSADLFISETDPFLLPPHVAAHARSQGARFIAYLQDIYPDIAVAIGQAKEGWVTRTIRNRLYKAYSLADRIVVLGTDMRDRLVSWGLQHDRFEIVPNWIDCNTVVPHKTDNPFRAEHHLEDKFVVMHSGNMGMTQNLDVVIKASCLPQWPKDATLVMVGDGAKRSSLQELARNCPQGRVLFLPYQPRNALSQSLSAADLHLVSMDERITGCLFPSKLYGILASGSPSS